MDIGLSFKLDYDHFYYDLLFEYHSKPKKNKANCNAMS